MFAPDERTLAQVHADLDAHEVQIAWARRHGDRDRLLVHLHRRECDEGRLEALIAAQAPGATDAGPRAHDGGGRTPPPF